MGAPRGQRPLSVAAELIEAVLVAEAKTLSTASVRKLRKAWELVQSRDASSDTPDTRRRRAKKRAS